MEARELDKQFKVIEARVAKKFGKRKKIKTKFRHLYTKRDKE